MRKLVALSLLTLLLSLTACAGGTPKAVHAKCPACGYEFETPAK